MEDKTPNKENNNEGFGEFFMKTIRDMSGLREKPTLPDFPINKKIQKKLLKDHQSKKHQNNSEINKNKVNLDEDKKEIIKKVIYPSGIIKILIKNGNNQIIKEDIDYSNLKESYINNIKENVNEELIQIIENSFLLYNRRQIIRNIVKKPYSTKKLEEKIILWKHYIKTLTKDEKALLIRKLLYYIGKFSEKVYEEFIKIKEISRAYMLFLSNGKIEKNKNGKDIWFDPNEFYMMNSMLGYDKDGNPNKDRDKPSYRDEMKAMLLLQRKILNIKDELNGTGYGFVFLKELKEIGDMYTNTSYIFESIFFECNEIFDNKIISDIPMLDKIETFRILWNYFVDYFIDDSFVIKFLIELKFIFGAYKQDEIVKLMHNLVLYRWNTFDILKDIKKNLEKILGPEEIFDEKEKVEKMNNIDDILNYIEGDVKPKKKKKKKKKKNQSEINITNEIKDEKDYNNLDNSDDIDIDDSMSIVSEADSVLDSFKNDLIEETEFNTGNKIIPQLSSEFLEQFQNNFK